MQCTDGGVRAGQPLYCRVCNAAEFKPAGETRGVALSDSYRPLIDDIMPIVIISYQPATKLYEADLLYTLHYFMKSLSVFHRRHRRTYCHISSPTFCACYRHSVLIRRPTSGFTDDVIFAHRPYGCVSIPYTASDVISSTYAV